MRRRISAMLAAAALAAAAPPLAAQRAPAAAPAAPISAREIDAHLRFLSSDLLEGRAPATRGGRLASEYIASQLMACGVRPAGENGGYFQDVPIDVVTERPASIRVAASGKATATLRDPEDVVVWAGSAAPRGVAKGELVFVGYGIRAPEYRWDDFKGADLAGKVLLVLVNDPPATAAEPDLFGGRAMTYYGRWTYKFEEAERQGAAGMLIVHTTERAGYPWHTVVGSWSTPQRMLPRDPALPPPLGVRGWITDSAATALLAQAGLDLARLRSEAGTRGFRPVDTGIAMELSLESDVAHMKSRNVLGIVRGSDRRVRDEGVVLSAHWDHLGIGPAVDGDSIYNGALDNASGVADLLAMARAAATSPAPRRSLLFAFVAAEESGLLGSEYLARHSPFGVAGLVADVNIDGGNLLGRVNDLSVLGADRSSLGATLAKQLAAAGMRISPDEHPEQGHFYRSDHFSCAKVGVPSVSIGAGTDFVGRPAGWGKQQDEDYTAHRYHQPSDEYRPDFDLSGAVQLSRLVLRLADTVADAPGMPTWRAGAEFKRASTSSER